jgi:sulfatase maturation enzyme AslB (radical SAM superfamily)
MILQTKSGLFVRHEPNIGLLTYSPFSGLIHACDNSDKDYVLKWLNKEKNIHISEEYIRALGAGWAIDFKDAEYPVPHMLPTKSEKWINTIPYPKKPILINWLITGSCPLMCKYCYAEDLMRDRYPEPKVNDIKLIAKTILKYNPLVVVLTGGDPLVSPFLELTIKLLYNKTGIIIDTSAYIFNESHLNLFKKYNVIVRISLDSEIPSINDKLRPINSSFKKAGINSRDTVSSAIYAIYKCIDAGVKVAVQSVATKVNHSDFEAMGDKLFKLGVGGWRILMVAPSKLKYDEYQVLCGDQKFQKRFYNHILKAINKKYKKDWRCNMSVQVAHNKTPNAVILVSPNGTFLTESNIGQVDGGGKVIIDIDNPKKPKIQSIFDSINMHAHAERYLNINN